MASDVTGVNNGLSLGSLETYTYTASLWICDAPVNGDTFSGCDRNDDPVLAGGVTGGDLLDFLMESPDGTTDTYGDILTGIIVDLFDDGVVVNILGSDLSLGVWVNEFEVGAEGDTFDAFLVKYLGYDADCAILTAETGDLCDGFYVEGAPDLVYSLALTIEDDASVIPLPASFPLILAGIGAIGFVGRRKKK